MEGNGPLKGSPRFFGSIILADDAVAADATCTRLMGLDPQPARWWALFDKWDCAMEERELAPGDAVLLYTDGVTEALNDEGEEFGEERLLKAARDREQSLPELLTAVAGQTRRFSPHEQADDITLRVAKCP